MTDGRMKVNVGTEDSPEWKFFLPQPGENSGQGHGFINVGDNESREWKKIPAYPA